MKKGLKQKQRRKQMAEMEAKWNPVAGKHGEYNKTTLRDSMVRLRKKRLEDVICK